MTVDQPWRVSHRADPEAKLLADRHYNRQKPWSKQFVPPGSCAVFLSDDKKAFWVTSAPKMEFVKHAWPGSWVCSAFRNEGSRYKASHLIRSAIAATVAFYGKPNPLGMVTFIDTDHVKPIMMRGKPVYGWTWLKAGFYPCGKTKGGLLAFHISCNDMPQPLEALPKLTIPYLMTGKVP